MVVDDGSTHLQMTAVNQLQSEPGLLLHWTSTPTCFQFITDRTSRGDDQLSPVACELQNMLCSVRAAL